eukprot:9200471-Alexandrium_andersonii.AAC.1
MRDIVSTKKDASWTTWSPQSFPSVHAQQACMAYCVKHSCFAEAPDHWWCAVLHRGMLVRPRDGQQ